MRAREILGQSINVIAFHCSNEKFDTFRINPNRGIYFSNHPDEDYGCFIYRCRIKLNNAYYALSVDNFEIDRIILINKGYDGRIVDYQQENFGDEEMFDYIAFYNHQIEILEIIDMSL